MAQIWEGHKATCLVARPGTMSPSLEASMSSEMTVPRAPVGQMNSMCIMVFYVLHLKSVPRLLQAAKGIHRTKWLRTS